MKNIEVEVKGSKLTIKIDLTKEFGASASGKSIIIATTAGNQPVPNTDGVQFGLNVFKSNK